MITRKLVHALEKLDKKSLQRFAVFLDSPYFNVNAGIRRFYQLILQSLLTKEKEKWASDEEIWEGLFPGAVADRRKLNLLYFNLGKLFDDYLSQVEFDEMLLMKDKVLIDALWRGKMADIHKMAKLRFDQSLKNNMDYSSQYAVFQYFLLKSGQKNPLYASVLHWINLYFILEKMQTFISLLSWKKMYKLEEDLHFMDYVFKISKTNEFSFFPSIKVYQRIINILKNEDDTDSYFELRKLMKEYFDKFSIDYQREMYSAALGYCILKVNQSFKEFNREVFELYKESVENKIILVNDEMTVSDFRNIVVLALRVDEFEWTEQFIKLNNVFVNQKYRDNAVNFSLARLEMNRENYDKALDYLQLINYDDVWYQLGARTMQVSAYYELEEYDALESFLNAFKMYINREKSLTKERKTTYLNLIKYTKKLICLTPGEKSKVQKIKAEIEQNSFIVNKGWLLEKVNEFSK